MNKGIFFYSGEKERKHKTEALQGENVDVIVGVERVYSGDVCEHNTFTELLTDDLDEVFVYEVADLGRTFKGIIASIYELADIGCRLQIVSESDDAVDFEKVKTLCESAEMALKEIC